MCKDLKILFYFLTLGTGIQGLFILPLKNRCDIGTCSITRDIGRRLVIYSSRSLLEFLPISAESVSVN